MYRMNVFPPQAAPVESVAIDYNQQLQDLVDSSGQVKTAIENIDQASPVDLTPLLAKLDAQMTLIDTFKTQSDNNQLSTKVAVDAVRTAVATLDTTVQDAADDITNAISQASADQQATLTAQLDATKGALVNTIVAESNETQGLITDTNTKLDTLISKLTLPGEQWVSVADDIDTTQGPVEIVLPAGAIAGDIGSTFKDPSGVEVLEGAEFDVYIGGKKEHILKNGEWMREYRPGPLGVPVQMLGLRIVIQQAPTLTHVSLDYPVSLAPAGIVTSPVSVAPERTPLEILAPIVGRIAAAADNSQFAADDVIFVKLRIAIGSSLESINSLFTVMEGVPGSLTPRPITQQEYDALVAVSNEELTTLYYENHPFLTPLVGNVYKLGDGAPTTILEVREDIRDNARTFTDLTSGSSAILIDIDGDGSGDRALLEDEFNSLFRTTVNAVEGIRNAAIA